MRRLLPSLAAIVVLYSCASIAQSPGSAGISSVAGSVADSSGAAIPGVTLRVETPQHQALAEAKADASGHFLLRQLPAGDFTLVVPASHGFASVTLPLHLTGAVANLKVTVPLATVAEQVDVTPEASLSTDASANKDAVSIGPSEIRTIPVFDQDIVATLTPFLDVSSGSSGGATIIVDGIERKSVGVSASAIQEIRINNDPYSTEYNRPGRGRIEIITKPGSPEYHGEFNFTFRDAVFNAKNYFATVRPPEQRRIYEGNLSGPVGRSGHTTFILSGARKDLDSAVSVDAITGAGPVHLNVLAPTRYSQLTGRVTHDFSDAHRLAVGYNFEFYTDINSGVGSIVLPEAGSNTTSREDDVIFNDRIIISPRLINQLAITMEKDEDVVRSQTNAPSIQVNGSYTGGGAQADVASTENTAHINEVLSWSHGPHYIRVGALAPQISRRAVDDSSNRLGTLKYASLATQQANNPYSFTVQQGPGRGLYWINELAGFAQDQIKLNPRTQLSLGVRYEWQTYLSDNNNFAPRASLAYAPGSGPSAGKTVFRVGAGVFYDRTGGGWPGNVKLHNGTVLRSYQVLNPGNSTVVPPGTPTGLIRFAPGIRTPYSLQYSAGVEHQLHKTVTLTATYRGSTGIKSFRSRDANAPLLPPDPTLSANYPRPDPSFGEIQQVESGGRQRVNALDLSFRGSAGRIFTGQAQYTIGRTSNNTNGLNWFPQDQYHPNNEWARADYDRLSRFNLLGHINQGHWLSLGVAATLYSGAPYTETTGNDDFHTGLGNARPAGVARNTLHAGGAASLDLLWDHDFKLGRATGEHAKFLSTGVSAFNLLNRANFTNYIGDLSSPLFQHPTAAAPGRQMQFAVGYRF